MIAKFSKLKLVKTVEKLISHYNLIRQIEYILIEHLSNAYLIFSIFYQKFKQKMSYFHQKLIIITLVIRLAFSNIANINFNLTHQINHNPYYFAYPTISKVVGDHLYVSQNNQNIRKINLVTGTQLGVLAGAIGSLVNDFDIFGTNLVACYNDKSMRTWNTQTFTQIRSTIVIQACQSIVYLQDVDRLLWSVPFLQRLELSYQNFSTVYIQSLNASTLRFKFCLSQNRDSLVTIKEDNQYTIGILSYNSSSINYVITLNGSQTNPSLGNRLYAANNVSFTFYILSQSAIHQLSYNSGITSYYSHLLSGGILLPFKQIVNDRVAYVTDLYQKRVNFIGKSNFLWEANFTLSENITDLQMSADNRVLILICQSQIRTYQITCLNSYYYDPTTFDCLQCDATCLTCLGVSSCTSCSQGKFIFNFFCAACEVSCLSCDNKTGCIECVSGMQPIGIGLLCQPIPNSNPSSIPTNPENKTSDSTIHQKLMYFLILPSSLKVPIQSSVLIFIADFWIYNYHNRIYGQKVSQVFQFIQMIENQKWAFAKFDKHLNLSLNPQDLGFSNYLNYSNSKFLAVEQKSSTFIQSMSQFFLYFLPIVTLFFLLYRFIFYKTFNYRISRHFRKYAFNYFIVFLLTDGNFEYMCYCCFNQSQMLFFFSFIDKINAWVWAIFFFLATLHTFGGFYITYWVYGKLSIKFIDETKKMLPSFVMYTIMANGKSFMLAAIQSFLFKFYTTQIFAMLGVHFLLIITLLYCQIKYGIFKRAIFFNFLLLQTVIKILINFLFLIQHKVQSGDNSAFDTLEDCLIIALYIWGITIIFGIISSFFPQTKKIEKAQYEKEKNKDNQIKQAFQYIQNDEINDGINNNRSQKAKIKQKNVNVDKITQNRLRFANRQDIIVFEFLDLEPMPTGRYTQRQQNKRIRNVQKSNNQGKIQCKRSKAVCKKINRKRKNQGGQNYIVLNQNGMTKNNKTIQELIFDPRTQVSW